MEFQSLDSMAKEYRGAQASLERRIDQLRAELTETKGAELRRRMKARIGMLYILRNEACSTAYYLETYRRNG